MICANAQNVTSELYFILRLPPLFAPSVITNLVECVETHHIIPIRVKRRSRKNSVLHRRKLRRISVSDPVQTLPVTRKSSRMEDATRSHVHVGLGSVGSVARRYQKG